MHCRSCDVVDACAPGLAFPAPTGLPRFARNDGVGRARYRVALLCSSLVIASRVATWQSTGSESAAPTGLPRLRLTMTARGQYLNNAAPSPSVIARSVATWQSRDSVLAVGTGLPRLRLAMTEWGLLCRVALLRPCRHCEERSDVAIHGGRCWWRALDCRASLAMTEWGLLCRVALLRPCRHCEERSDVAIHGVRRWWRALDCRALLAMTEWGN